jgi:dipeptidyl aminopeptidase/acylaminoacyl peptidase
VVSERTSPLAETLHTEELFFSLRIPYDAQLSPDEQRVAFVVFRPDRERNDFERTLHVITVADGAEAGGELAPPGVLPRWAPDGRTLAFARGAEGGEPAGIFAWEPGGGPPRRICAAEGVADLAWSPDGASLAFVATPPDTRDPLAPLVYREGGFRVNGSPLPVPWSQLFLVARDGAGALRQLTTLDRAVGSPRFSPDGGRIAFSAGQHAHMPSHAYVLELASEALERHGPDDGECETVDWTPDGAALLFVGKRDARRVGHTRAFLLSLDDGELRELAPELDRSVELSHVYWPGATPTITADGRHVLFAAHDRGRVWAYRAGLDGGPAEVVLDGATEAVRGLSLGPTLLATVIAAAGDPGDVVVAKLDGSERRRLTDLNGTRVRDGLALPQERRFTAADGTEVHAIVLRDPSVEGPTPLVLDIHGGPHSAWVLSFRDVEIYNWEFVARGYTVLLVNPRGSVGYGEEHYRGVLNGWGEHDLQDFMACVDGLVAEGLVDPQRMSATGYSYGGFMTNYLLANTDRFVSGVSQACNSDMVSMYGATAVKHLISCELSGPPAGRWELYDRLSPLRRSEHVTAPILFVTGLEDETTPVAQGEVMFTILSDLGRETELVLYPGADHLGGGWPLSQRLDLHRRIVGWVERHTPPAHGGG